jgi:predicted ATP-dependent endonuclease of OLD family
VRIYAIDVSNFRALRNSTLTLFETTALIGENNSGKSAFLSAIDLFFSPSPRIRTRDFSDSNIEQPIDITLHFKDLTADDHKEFDEYLLEGELVVTRRFFLSAGKESGKYFVSARVNPNFAACRDEEKANPKRALYKKLQEIYDLADVKNADEIEFNLSAWEAKNYDKLSISKIANFKGWTNVASGKLKQKTDFVFIRAVEDAAENIQESKNSPVKNLVNTIAKQAIENSSAFKDFMLSANAKIAELTDPSAVPVLADISEQLTKTLSNYYKDSGINATWDPITQLQPSFPSANIEVIDNDFANAIDGVGHGLQRAVILTVLQFMAEHRAKQALSGEQFTEAQSDLILAIEEPEIYQHPIKQRLFAKLLSNLAKGFNEQSGIRVQIIYVTHSPLMVSLSNCEAIRMIRRIKTEKGRNVVQSSISLSECSKKIATLSGLPEEAAWSADNFAAKLHIFRPEIAEGFFGSKVVLVEGVGDEAVLNAWYKIADRDPLAEGIVIVGVGGKSNLPKVITVFGSLGIPCYWIFDSDQKKKQDEGSKKDSISTNRLLQRLSGLNENDCEDWPQGIFAKHTVWDERIETYVRSKAGPEKFDAVRTEVATNWKIDPALCLKFPAASSSVLILLRSEGIQFPELDGLVKAIDDLAC